MGILLKVFTVIWDMWYWKVWFDMIWFDLNRHSKSHWKQYSLRKWIIYIHCWFASNKYFFISFSFSRFRCSCSRKLHSRNAERMEWKLEKTTFLSLAEKRRRESSSIVVEIVICSVWIFIVCLITINFNHSSNPIAREFYPVWQMRKVILFFLFFLEFHQLLRTSRFQIYFHISYFQQSSSQKEEIKQIQNILCKCGWDFDHFHQFDQNRVFSNHKSTKNDDCFRFARIDNNLRNLQIWKTKRMRFHFLFVFIITEKKERIVKFNFIFQ